VYCSYCFDEERLHIDMPVVEWLRLYLYKILLQSGKLM